MTNGEGRIMLGVVAVAIAAVSALGTSGCDDSDEQALPAPVPDAGPPVDAGPDGAPSIEAGPVPGPCPAGELELDGGACQPAGVPPDGCGEGFVSDGEAGCVPVLPEEPCPAGLMALPGEAECRELVPCGAAPWGDIPLEANTQYVDESYPGGDSDGTTDKPWTSIQTGVDAAEPGAVVAVAAGTYLEDVLIADKPVRLWGRCPALVELVGQGTLSAVIDVEAGADASEIHALAITADFPGIAVGGVQDVLFDGVWVHDANAVGIMVQDHPTDTSAVLRGCLFENVSGISCFVWGSELVIEDTEIRETLPSSNLQFGRGVSAALDSQSGRRSTVEIHHSVIRRSHAVAVAVFSSSATIEDSYLVETLPQGDDDSRGWAVSTHLVDGTGQPNDVTIRRSVIDNSRNCGVCLFEADGVLEHTVIRDTHPSEQDDSFGDGVAIFGWGEVPDFRPRLELRSSLVERSHTHGVVSWGSDVTLEAMVIRDTFPEAASGSYGRGLSLSGHRELEEQTVALVAGSVVEGSGDCGMCVFDSQVTIEATVVRDTLGNAEGRYGNGLSLMSTDDWGPQARAELRHCVVESNRQTGVAVTGAELLLEDTVIAGVLPNHEGLYGDGLNVSVYKPPLSALLPGAAEIHRCRIEQSTRAGVASFGSIVGIAHTELTCNGLSLNGELLRDQSFEFEDLGGNSCQCGGVVEPCVVLSTGLTPPEAPTPSSQTEE